MGLTERIASRRVGGACDCPPRVLGVARSRATFRPMWVSKISEIIGSSSESFEAAASAVVKRASRTLQGIRGIDVLSKTVRVEKGEIVEFRVRLRLVFDLAPHSEQHW